MRYVDVDLLVGRSLGDFVLRQRIGEGGFGAVYRATQSTLDREAVIKVLHGRLHASAHATERFLREARLASKLDHPYAAHIYAFGAEDDGQLWIAMELVRGTSLDRLLRAQGSLSLERLVPLLDRICEVVHTAHEQGIVHRDIKPANVMVLARAGRLLPKLLDFGIAKGLSPSRESQPSLTGERTPLPSITSDTTIEELPDQPVTHDTLELTQRGAIIGSPLYMAPEQWVDAGHVDARTDLYALGVVAYECLTGKPPFRGDSVAETAAAHAEDPIPPLGSRFPAALSHVLEKALAKDPADRYPDALTFAAAFRQASGIASESVQLPSLDAARRDAAVAMLPQPIAEAVAAFDTARNAHQARGALSQLVRTVARYLGLLALACRSRIASSQEPMEIGELVRALHVRPLTDREWIELARAATQTWLDRRDAYPVPELVDALQDAELASALDALVAMRDRETPTDDALLELLEEAIGPLGRTLDALAFLASYPLVVVRAPGLAEQWMGARRTARHTSAIAVSGIDVGAPALLDSDGAPVLALAPLLRAAAPLPGEPLEMFLFEGRGQRGARMVALPAGFELHDDDIWDWLRAQLASTLEDFGPSVVADRPPYRGLAAFTQDDAASFFGRERLVDAFVNRLQLQPLLAVVGRSGAGKSSFVHAGVIPALAPGWRTIVMRPGAQPMGVLAARLEHAGCARVAIDGDRHALGAMLREDAAARGPIVLVVDQLEEIFTLCQDETERRTFVDALATAARAAIDPVRVVFTLRDDFLVRCEQIPALRDRIGQGLQLLTVPTPEDLVRILVEPARRAGFTFEDAELPLEMVREVADQPGALALISFTASKLWELRDRHFKQLTRSAYKSLGGVGGALARHADITYDAMPPEERALTREAFRHLVTTQHTRAVLARSDLRQLLGASAHADRVIEKLVAARLLVASENETGAETIEIVHEALLAAWPRLVDWQREDSEGARLREQLRAAAEQWHERGRPRGLLWRGDALADLHRWRARHPGPLTELEGAFADASTADAARGRRLRRALVATAFFALVVVVVGLVVFNTQIAGQRRALRDNLERQFEDEGRRLVLAGDPLPALAYLAKAAELGASGRAHDLLVAEAVQASDGEQIAVHHSAVVHDVAFSPDGDRLITACSDRHARVWDAHTGKLLLSLAHEKSVGGAAFSPDGATVLTAGGDGAAVLWDSSSGVPLARFTHTGAVTCALYAKHGDLAVTAGGDGVALWNLPGGTPRAKIPDSAGTRACAISDDGTRIAAGDENGVARVWDTRTGALVRELHEHRGTLTHVELSANGTRLISAGEDGRAIVSDVDSGERLLALAHEAAVTTARFDHSERWIVTASNDRSVAVWDAETGARRFVLAGHVAGVDDAVFSPDGSYIADASADGTAWLWDATTGRVAARWRGHRDDVTRAAFDRTGSRIATAGLDGDAIVWAARPQSHVVRLIGHTAAVLATSFSADGTLVVTAGADGTARLWDAASGRSVLAITDKPAGEVWDAVLSPDGASLLTAGISGTLTVWDVATGKPKRALGPPRGSITQARWSPDASLIAASSSDGWVRGWTVATGEIRFEIKAHDGYPVQSVSFSPDGQSLVTSGGGDGYIRTWRLDGTSLARYSDPTPFHVAAELDATGTRLLTASATRKATISRLGSSDEPVELVGHVGFINYASWSPDGAFVVTAAVDGTARVWDAATGAMLAIMEHRGVIHYASFSPDGRHIAIAGDDGFAQIYELPPPVAPAELARVLRCRVPLEVRGDQLHVIAGVAGDCR